MCSCLVRVEAQGRVWLPLRPPRPATDSPAGGAPTVKAPELCPSGPQTPRPHVAMSESDLLDPGSQVKSGSRVRVREEEHLPGSQPHETSLMGPQQQQPHQQVLLPQQEPPSPPPPPPHAFVHTTHAPFFSFTVRKCSQEVEAIGGSHWRSARATCSPSQLGGGTR